MAERSLRFDLIARDKSFSKTLDAAGRKGERLNRTFTRTLGQTGDRAGREFGVRLNKRLGAGLSASARVARVGAGAIGAGLAVAGLTQFATDSVQLAATFDKTMRQVAVATRTPTSRIDELRKVALKMGATTSFSAREASEAMLSLGKGGLSFAEQKAGALSATLTLAAAGGLELGAAADYVVQGLRAFGLRADKAATVAAALAGAANASTSNVEDMGLALSQTAAGARNAGLSIEETTGVLAAFANNGIRGSDAGTSLKTMLTRLVPTTEIARRKMADLNLSFVDSRGAILPITEIAQRLQNRLGGLSDAQRTAALATIFGSDATRAATILMREGATGLAKYIKATSDRGAAEKLAKTNTEGAAGAFERLSGAIETVQIVIGDAFLPKLADAAEWLAKALPAALDKVQRGLATARQWWDDNQVSITQVASVLRDLFSPAADNAAASIGRVEDSSISLSDALDSTLEVVARLTQGWNWLVIATGETAATIGDLVIGTGYAVNAVDKLSGGTGHAADEIVRFGRELKSGAIDRLGEARRSIDTAQSSIDNLASRTGAASTAADRHTTALRAERQAVDALKNALAGEETAELDVRQAKLNVASAQERLTGLVKGGRRGSLEYRQAQIDLKRAQLDLKAKTDEYKGAQQRASAATSGAMQATQRAQGPYRKFGETARTAGGRAYAMGKSARDGLNLIQSRRVTIRATFGFKTPPDVSMHDIVGATGGYVTPTAITPRRLHRGGLLDGPGTETSDSIPARLSKGEYVVRAKAVKAVGRDTLDHINAQGFATGGPVLDAKFPSTSPLLKVVSRFEGAIDRVLTRLAGKWDRYAEKTFGGAGKPAILRFIRSTDPLPYRWGAAGPGAYDCSGLAGAVTAAHVGRPYGHGQRYFTTGSIRAGVLGLKSGLGGTLQIGVTAGSGHMAGRYGGLGFEAESSRTGIKIGSAASRPESFARHYHLAKGGPVEEELLADLARIGGLDIGGDRGRLRVNGQVFDRGGYLMPGTTVATNRTSKPEKVIGPQETMTVNLTPAAVRALGRVIIDGMVAAGVGAVNLDSRRANQILAGAGLSNDRRR